MSFTCLKTKLDTEVGGNCTYQVAMKLGKIARKYAWRSSLFLPPRVSMLIYVAYVILCPSDGKVAEQILCWSFYLLLMVFFNYKLNQEYNRKLIPLMVIFY
ncbi:hypothetical protein ACH5RR_029519 [Cinchona calisaya]|uniref:Uncharacterized protein n=1 Tax=Cinchona calisaya TaxID=153742 RepID=A0ABD2YS01_9GENT